MLGFEGLKPMLMKIEDHQFQCTVVFYQSSNCCWRALQRIKDSMQKFQRLLCKASAAEEHSKLNKKREMKIKDMFIV